MSTVTNPIQPNKTIMSDLPTTASAMHGGESENEPLASPPMLIAEHQSPLANGNTNRPVLAPFLSSHQQQGPTSNVGAAVSSIFQEPTSPFKSPLVAVGGPSYSAGWGGGGGGGYIHDTATASVGSADHPDAIHTQAPHNNISHQYGNGGFNSPNRRQFSVDSENGGGAGQGVGGIPTTIVSRADGSRYSWAVNASSADRRRSHSDNNTLAPAQSAYPPISPARPSPSTRAASDVEPILPYNRPLNSNSAFGNSHQQGGNNTRRPHDRQQSNNSTIASSATGVGGGSGIYVGGGPSRPPGAAPYGASPSNSLRKHSFAANSSDGGENNSVLSNTNPNSQGDVPSARVSVGTAAYDEMAADAAAKEEERRRRRIIAAAGAGDADKGQYAVGYGPPPNLMAGGVGGNQHAIVVGFGPTNSEAGTPTSGAAYDGGRGSVDHKGLPAQGTAGPWRYMQACERKIFYTVLVFTGVAIAVFAIVSIVFVAAERAKDSFLQCNAQIQHHHIACPIFFVVSALTYWPWCLHFILREMPRRLLNGLAMSSVCALLATAAIAGVLGSAGVALLGIIASRGEDDSEESVCGTPYTFTQTISIAFLAFIFVFVAGYMGFYSILSSRKNPTTTRKGGTIFNSVTPLPRGPKSPAGAHTTTSTTVGGMGMHSTSTSSGVNNPMGGSYAKGAEPSRTITATHNTANLAGITSGNTSSTSTPHKKYPSSPTTNRGRASPPTMNTLARNSNNTSTAAGGAQQQMEAVRHQHSGANSGGSTPTAGSHAGLMAGHLRSGDHSSPSSRSVSPESVEVSRV